MVVPRTVPPSLIVTTALAWPVPLIAGFEVIPSLAELPVSETRPMLSAGAVLSSVKLSVAVPVLPAASVWLAVRVCAPSASPAGVKLQAPAASAVVVPRTAPPSLIVTTALAWPVPLIAGFEVIPSLAELPVSETRPMLSAGAVLSSVKLSVAVPVLPARSVWQAVSVCAPSASPAGV